MKLIVVLCKLTKISESLHNLVAVLCHVRIVSLFDRRAYMIHVSKLRNISFVLNLRLSEQQVT